jgi:flavocytochrome c
MKKELSRRTFLKGVALTGAAAAGAGMLSGCQSAAGVSDLPEEWDAETDVVVVGYGGAGAAAAVEALDAGAEVIVLEKREVKGGTSAISGGLVYAGGTSVQAAHDIEDSADLMYEHYMNCANGMNNPDMARLAADRSADNIDWLIDLGGEFPNAPSLAGQEPNVGSEPIPRVHGITYGDLAGGAAFFRVMGDAAEEKGATVMMNTAAQELVVRDGEVVGVRVESEGEEMYIKARKGVILTTGGFTRDEEMLAAHSRQGFYSQPLGAPGLTGDGHRMAFALGAGAANMSEVLGIPGLTLPGAVSATYALWTFSPDLPGLLINIEGKRFTDEFSFYDWKNTKLLYQPEARCYSVFDDTMRAAGAGRIVSGFSESLEEEVENGLVFRADTLAELAQQLDIPVGRFEETVAQWNANAAQDADPDFGRTASLEPVETPPFYAFETFPTMFDNSGGIKTDTDARVITVWDQPIPRLYAAGQLTGGVIGEHYPGSGTALNVLLTFGRIAGANAAAEEAWE